MEISNTQSSKAPKHSRHEDAAGIRINPGPFVGVVKNNIDSMRSGRLQVYIPELGGDEDNDSSWRTVHYCTPFYGQTSPDLRSTGQDFTNSPHSYGMWFVPPDIGVSVLCTFVNGDPFRGYWFGCIPDWPNLHMIPGISSGMFHGGSPDPLVEYNDNDPATHDNEGTFFKRATTSHDYQKQVYQRQGLLQDPVRGPGISSAFRETPSRVFGISTPGPDLVLPAGTNDEGEVNTSPPARQGGHQFIMDDGDVNGNSQLIKLRTSNGNMLLLNDSAGIVYLINASGSAWFEMDGGGNVRIFSQAKMEMHATAGIVLETPSSVKISGSTIDIAASGPLKLKGATVDIMGMGGVKVGGMGDLHLSGMKTYLSGMMCVGISGGQHIDQKAGCITLNSKKVKNASPPGMAMGGQGPSHEPFGGHQNSRTNSPASSPSQAAVNGVPSAAGASGSYGAASSFGTTKDVPSYYGVLTNASGPIKFNPGLQASYAGQGANLGDASTLNVYDETAALYTNVDLPLPVSSSGFAVNLSDPTATTNKNLKPGEALNNPGDLTDLTLDPFAIGQVNGLNSYATPEDGIAALSTLLDLIQSDGANTLSDFIKEYIARKGG